MDASNTKVVTSKARASYAYVFEPQQGKGNSKAKYSTVLVFYPSPETTATRKNLLAAATVAGRKKFGDKFDAMVKSGAITAVGGKGAILRTDGIEEKYPGAEFYFSARNEHRPGLVDSNMQPIIDKDAFYSGCWMRVSVTAFGYDTEGNKGVSWSLGNIQKVADGERLDNRATPDQEFTPISADQTPMDKLFE